MKLREKFFLPIIVFTVLISIAIAFGLSRKIKEYSLQRVQVVTADYIRSKALERLTPENFRNKDFSAEYKTFETFMNLFRTNEIIKIKVFNADYHIIFSTSAKDIGQITESRNYQKSLSGQVVASIKPPVDEASNVDIYGYKQVMEVYVPIAYEGKVEGVIEAYYKMDFINEHIAETTRLVLILIAVSAVSMLLSVYLILQIVIISPVTKLKQVSNKVSNGDLDIQLPDIKSKDEIRDLNEALKGVFAAIEFLTDEIKNKDRKE